MINLIIFIFFLFIYLAIQSLVNLLELIYVPFLVPFIFVLFGLFSSARLMKFGFRRNCYHLLLLPFFAELFFWLFCLHDYCWIGLVEVNGVFFFITVLCSIYRRFIFLSEEKLK